MFAVIVLTILPLLWAYFEAHLDASKVLKGINITHFPSILLRIGWASIQSIIFYTLSPIFFISIVYQLSLFWIVFEITLNKLRDLPSLYIGSTSNGDKLIRKYFTTVQFFILKLAVLVVSIIAWIFVK